MDQALVSRVSNLKLLVLDVDGVLSDGKIYYSSENEEFKSFSILDGLGIKLLQKAGIQIAIITGRKSAIVEKRASELGIKHLLQGREDKLVALNELLSTMPIEMSETAYMGDDLPDLGAIKKAGFGITVSNGHNFVIQHADYCTSRMGGNGAVREVCDLILETKGLLDETLNSYLPD